LPEQPVNVDRNKIYAGMFMYYDSVHIYPTFLSSRKSYSDRVLIPAEGFLFYDKAQQLYKIGSEEKINNFSLPENYLSLHREDCRLYSEGKIDLGENLGQLKLKTYGNVVYEEPDNKTSLDLVLMIDFYLSEDMIQLMALEIDSAPRLDPVNMTRPVLTKTYESLIGAEQSKKLRDELTLFGTIKQLPDELKHTIVLTDLKFVWNDETNSYRSEGKIGIGSIGNVQINKKVNGFIELQIKRSGDIMDIYLEIDRRTYYYFGYTRGVMQTLSSNREYVETIMNMKARDRKKKVSRGETSYIYMIATDRKKTNFYRRYREAMEEKADMENND
jgi:hypothetical protein